VPWGGGGEAHLSGLGGDCRDWLQGFSTLNDRCSSPRSLKHCFLTLATGLDAIRKPGNLNTAITFQLHISSFYKLQASTAIGDSYTPSNRLLNKARRSSLPGPTPPAPAPAPADPTP
jgi:hypothetical protein